MAGAYTNLLYHVIFSTKHRKPLITSTADLYDYIGGIIRGQKGILLEIGGFTDHLHLVVKLRTDVSVAEMVRLIKCNSSKWMNEQRINADRFEWQTGYGTFTVSTSQLAALREYVQNQESHHRKQTFQEEFVGFLKRHGVEYEERYLWD